MDIWWLFLPILLVSSLYTAAAFFVWPYGRPLFPVWFLLLAIFVPPLFPLVFAYILLLSIAVRPVVAVPTARKPVVVVVEASSPRARITTRPAGNRV